MMAEKEIKVEISAGCEKLVSAVDKAKASMEDLANVQVQNPSWNPFKRLIDRTKDSIDRTKDALKGVKDEKIKDVGLNALANNARKAAKETKRLKTEQNSLRGVLSGVRSAALAAFSIGAVVTFGKAVMKASADMELLKKGLAFTLGNTGAQKLIENMQTLGEKSAYNSNQLIPLARAWITVGDNAQTATAKMKKIVDCASAYGLTEDQMSRVNLALTQMQAKGKVSSEEMRQLAEAGVPAWQLLSTAMGKPVNELQNLAAQGKLTQSSIDMWFDGMAQKTQGATNSMANTMEAKFSNIQEAVTNSFAAIGDIIAQGFGVSDILTLAGNLAEGMKQHFQNIRDNAKQIGVKNAIVKELQGISPVAAAVFNGIATIIYVVTSALYKHRDAALAVGKAILGIWIAAKTIIGVSTIINTLVTAWKSLKLAIALARAAVVAFRSASLGTAVVNGIITGLRAAWAGLTVAMGVAKTAALAFRAACIANPVLVAIALIIAAIILIATHWDTVKRVALACWRAICGAISEAGAKLRAVIGGAIDWVKNKWEGLKAAVSHPLDFVVHETHAVTQTVTGGKAGGTPAKPTATGGIFGGAVPMATGGMVGGKIPALANGGQLKHGTPAIVGEAGPEAVIPLKDSVLSQIGAAIMTAYQKGKNTKETELTEIQAKIKTLADTKELDAYAKVMKEAADKAAEVGKEVQTFNAYQKEANKTAAAYGDIGEKTIAMKERALQITKEIADLTAKVKAGKASDVEALKVRALAQEKEELLKTYDEEKAAAIKAAQDAASARLAIEKQAGAAIENLQLQTAQKVNSRALALQQARMQEEKADTATCHAQYMAYLKERSDAEGANYATILANESQLAQQRQAWHEQLMVNAADWSMYMDTILTNLSQNLTDGLAAGLAECIVKGQNLGDTFNRIAENLAINFLQGVLQKAIGSLGILQNLGNQTAKQEISNAKKETAAQAGKTGVLAANATASYIAAMPFMAFGAAGVVSGQMLSAKMAGMGMSAFASGGYVSGAGTGKSDSIPAMLSNGEYVINADAVRRVGVSALNRINQGTSVGFADGGSVGTLVTTAGTAPLNIHISALDASSFMDFLHSGGLDTLRQALFDNDRNFATEAGVF
ncbi:tape measure protein [uncultured Megasphaera sp.]|uniref:tape measure protein n=1 Tax=uncultured Megasphaera sp. TaxID=165188 RepID=UPI002889E8F3|nr:tape measure protein [uncultured Megasphaera sp.]